MLNEKQVQEAIARVDGLLSKARFTEPILNRVDHITLVNDMKLIQHCCREYFDDKNAAKAKLENEDGGTNIIPINPEPGDENIEGGGDSV